MSSPTPAEKKTITTTARKKKISQRRRESRRLFLSSNSSSHSQLHVCIGMCMYDCVRLVVAGVSGSRCADQAVFKSSLCYRGSIKKSGRARSSRPCPLVLAQRKKLARGLAFWTPPLLSWEAPATRLLFKIFVCGLYELVVPTTPKSRVARPRNEGAAACKRPCEGFFGVVVIQRN